MKKRLGWFGWLWRSVAVVAGSLVLLFGAAVAYELFVAMPKARAQAEAFARLKGPARRLAIYDAFTGAIDQYYFDQSFAGFDWPAMKRNWRLKAAAASSDAQLYSDVFFPMAQTFPVSHVAVMMPPRSLSDTASSSASSVPPAPTGIVFSARDQGFDFVPLRRGKGTTEEVGEVWPGSIGARAGVQPGAAIMSLKMTSTGKSGHLSADLLCLTPDESQTLERLGTVKVSTKTRACQTGDDPRRMKVDYELTFTGAPPDIVVRRLPKGALYIRFDAFQDPVIDKVLAALKTADSRGMVLDLRFNNGGFPLRILAALIGGGQPAYNVRDSRGLHLVRTPFMTSPFAGPLVILTGPGSASASETVAAVVQARHRGTLIGRPTNGSLLGAKMITLPDGGTAEIPDQNLETVEGKRLEDVGVMPDIFVYPTVAQLRAGEDAALDRAESELAKAR